MDVNELLARQAIRDTIARYNLAGDRGRLAELADCFCEHGVLEVRDAWRAHGRREIEERLAGVRLSPESAADPILVRHHVTTHRAEIDGADSARAWTYFIVLTGIGLDHAGRYVDRFERVADDWLIAHRSVVLDWRAPGPSVSS